jgi:predicted enzyme related to lactoylglutathione lyase
MAAIVSPAGGYPGRVGQRTSYAPGTFCWADLATTDADAARAFYGLLLGWRGDPAMTGSGGYVTMTLDGAAVAGIAPQRPEQRAEGVPPSWLSYVSVEHADAATARATELGGAVRVPAFDVAAVGRMAVIADPQGAVFAVWQPGDMAGAELVNQAGTMTMNQLNTTDPAGARAFYEALFGWGFDQVAGGTVPFWSVTNDGTLNGGMMALDPSAPAPPHWLVYFTVDDLDGADALIVDGGGAVVVPPMAVPSGRFLVAHDPQYAFFALFEGDVDD